MTQREKAETFRALHEGEPFIIPNPWDAGSAKVLAALGFKALAGTSSGFAFTLGPAGRRRDAWTRSLDHIRLLDGATDLPVVDGPRERLRAVTRRRRPCCGRGGRGRRRGRLDRGLGPGDRAVPARRRRSSAVAAAVEAARALDFPFTLTARAENHIRGNPDLSDTVARLRAYEQAGADVALRPGAAQRRRGSNRLRGGVEARQRARPPRPDDARDRRRRRAAGERGRRAHVGRRRARWRPPPSRCATAGISRP